MIRRTGVTWVLAASALWLAGCDRGHEPEKGPAATSKAPSADVQQVTIHVPGMIDRQGIT